MTEGSNEKMLAITSGVYRGFFPNTNAGVDMVVRLALDPLASYRPSGNPLYDDSFAIVANTNAGSPDYEGWALSVREHDEVAIDLAGTALDPIPAGVNWLYLYITADYQVGQPTNTCTYNVSDENPHTSGSSNYDLDAIVLGRVAVTPGATMLNSPLTSSSEVAMLEPRTYPVPTVAVKFRDLDEGDNEFGLFDSVSKWRTPTESQKYAMEQANSPSYVNPFATENDTLKYLAEPAVASGVVAGNSNVPNGGYGEIQMVITSGKVYLGRGTIEQSLSYFVIADTDGDIASYDDGGGISLVDLTNVSTGAINPATDTDSEGFYDISVLGHILVWMRCWTDVPGSVTINVNLHHYVKKQTYTVDQSPVKGILYRQGLHAANVGVQSRENPPGWAGGGDLNQAIAGVHGLARGTAHESMTNAHVSGRSFWKTAKPDVYMGAYPVDLSSHLGAATDTIKYLTSFRTKKDYRYNDGSKYHYEPAGSVNYVFIISVQTGQDLVGLYKPQLDLFYSIDVIALAVSMPSPVYGSTYMLVGMCCDNDRLYIRFRDADGTGTGLEDHYVFSFDIYDDGTSLSLDTSWASPVGVVKLNTSGSPLGVFPQNRYEDDIIVADDNNLAACCSWTNIRGALVTAPGIAIIDKDTGVVTYGIGDAGSSITTKDAYPVGPMVSDGESVFCATVETVGSPAPDIMDYMFQVKISDPTTSAAANWLFPIGVPSSGRSTLLTGCIFDGVFLWVFMSDWRAASAGNVLSSVCVLQTSTSLQYLSSNLATDDLFGGVCFDGKNIWVAMYDKTEDLARMDRLVIERIAYEEIVASSAFTYTDLVEDRLSFVEAGYDQTGLIEWSRNLPHFDGDNILFAPERGINQQWSQFIMRLNHVKSRG